MFALHAQKWQLSYVCPLMAHCLVQDNCQLILFSQNYHLNDHRWLLNVKLKLIKLITANGKYVIVLNTTYMQETEKQTQQKLHCVTLHTHKGYLIFLLNMYQSPLFRYNRVKRLATPAFLHHDINCTWCWAVRSFNSAWWDKNILLTTLFLHHKLSALIPCQPKILRQKKKQFQNSMGLPPLAEHPFHLLAFIQTLTIHSVWQAVKKYLQREIPSQCQLWTQESVTQNIESCAWNPVVWPSKMRTHWNVV